MKIELNPFWGEHDEKVDTFEDGTWLISDLINKSKDLPVFDIPLTHLNLGGMSVHCVDVVDFARHMKHVENTDLKYPIILDFKGTVLNGRHRIIKALLQGDETIKAVRHTDWIAPTYPKE